MATSVLRTLALRLRLNSAQFQKDIGKVDRRMKKLSGSMRRSANMFNSQLGALGATFATGFGLGELKNAADTMVNLRNKMNATYETSQEVAQGMLDIKRVARESRSDLDSVGTLYQRIAVSTKNMGASQEEVAAITQVVSNSFLLSGTTASEAANSARQFAQGLASGALRGDEFRSVSENNVVLTRMLADGLNKTVGELREFSHAGGLTAEVMLPILMNNLGKTTDQVTNMRLNIGQATVLFKNNFTEMVDRVNSVFLVTDKTAVVINKLSENMHILTLGAAAFAALLLTKVLVGMVAWTAMTIATSVSMTVGLIPATYSLVKALGALVAAGIGAFVTAYGPMLAMIAFNPFTLIIAGAVALGALLVTLLPLSTIESFVQGIKQMGQVGAAVFDSMMNSIKRYMLHISNLFPTVKRKLKKFLKDIGADGLAALVNVDSSKGFDKALAELDANTAKIRTRIKDAVNGFSDITVDPENQSAFTTTIENLRKSLRNALSRDASGPGGEGGMFAGMVEGFSAGVDGILEKIMASNPTLAKFWATLKGENDPDAAAAEGGGDTAMADMSWADRWIAAIGRIKDTFKEMGDSARLTVKGMIERYDTFEEVLEKGIKNLKKNSHIRKGIMMKEALMEGKSAILKAWNSAPFPMNLPGVAITTAATAMTIRDIMKGQAHDGMDSLPSTGTYMLERGERVVSSRANRDLTEFLATNGKGGSSGSTQPITLQVNGISDPDMVVSALASRRGELEAMMRSIASENTRQSPF